MEGVRSLHLRLLDSIALLLYQSVPDGGLKIGGGKEVGESVGEDLVSEEVETMKKKGDVKKGPVIDKNVEKAVKKIVKTSVLVDRTGPTELFLFGSGSVHKQTPVWSWKFLKFGPRSFRSGPVLDQTDRILSPMGMDCSIVIVP